EILLARGREEIDPARLAVLEEAHVALLEVGDELALGVRRRHVDRDEVAVERQRVVAPAAVLARRGRRGKRREERQGENENGFSCHGVVYGRPRHDVAEADVDTPTGG